MIDVTIAYKTVFIQDSLRTRQYSHKTVFAQDSLPTTQSPYNGTHK